MTDYSWDPKNCARLVFTLWDFLPFELQHSVTYHKVLSFFTLLSCSTRKCCSRNIKQQPSWGYGMSRFLDLNL